MQICKDAKTRKAILVQSKIIGCYISGDNFVIAIATDAYYKYKHRLKKEKAAELVAKVINAGEINDEHWQREIETYR